jgi:NAD(P)-dependent dehydrogenase (short-subunit alcohol dehydrogenase family)
LTKTLLIVGGSSGIGAATLDLALLRGHRVIQASRHPELARVAPEVTSLEWDACAGEFPAQSLPDVLDSLVYRPGGIRLKPFARLSAAELREDLEVSLIGAVRAVQAALPALKRGQGAGIVLFSTVAVRLGMPFHAAVASAKGAVEGLTRALAAELAPGYSSQCRSPNADGYAARGAVVVERGAAPGRGGAPPAQAHRRPRRCGAHRPVVAR